MDQDENGMRDFSYAIHAALTKATANGLALGCTTELVIKPYTFRLEDGEWRIYRDWTWEPPRVDDPDLCPNGQRYPECTETDPCESCWQDDNEEGDMIERSMGLNNQKGN